MKKYINYYFNKINKILTIGSRPLSGRNFLGIICCHHKSGGNKKRLIFIDFYKRLNHYGFILNIIKNRNYTAYISGIIYENGLYAFILLTENINLGNKIYTGSYYTRETNQIGINVCIKFIKLFTLIHNIELFPFSKSILIRAAGGSGLIIKKEINKVVIKLKSG
jgi:large subunit ribosomal protein L2